MALSSSGPWRASGPTAHCRTHSPANRPLVVTSRFRFVWRPLNCISSFLKASASASRRRSSARSTRTPQRQHQFYQEPLAIALQPALQLPAGTLEELVISFDSPPEVIPSSDRRGVAQGRRHVGQQQPTGQDASFSKSRTSVTTKRSGNGGPGISIFLRPTFRLPGRCRMTSVSATYNRADRP